MNKEVLKRIPPGDRWQDIDENSDIFSSLTEGLAYIYEKYNIKIFTVDAQNGFVYIDDGEKPPIKKYNLYGE